MFLLYWTLQLTTVFAGFMCFYYTGRDTLPQKIRASGLAKNRAKSNGIIRVSAIAILLDAARNPFAVSLSAHSKKLRPVSVYKEIYSVFLVDAADTGRTP